MQTTFVTGPATTRWAFFQFHAQMPAWHLRSLFHDCQLGLSHPETMSLADVSLQPLDDGAAMW